MSEIYVALYRKYRPQTFEDVVGQSQVVALLKKAIEDKKISHAYLFCGGRGTGKTTVARIFARDIGCNPEDIIEIDAASNRGIDEIRELRDAVRTSPFSSPYKVYIIDEAHMLTKEAANALLKTLEEPPRHVIFVLATTDPEKLPATIVSRCQKVIFSTPDLGTLAKRLVHVAKEEGRKLDDATAHLIAKHGKGSYRDALGVLEQALTTFGELLEGESVRTFLGQPKHELVLRLLKAVCQKDTKNLIETITSLKKGGDAEAVYDELIDQTRLALLGRLGEGEVTEAGNLGKEFPLVVNSKLLLTLLEKKPLLAISYTHAWVALEAILVSLTEE